MSDGSEVVYSYVADATGVMDAIDEVSAGIQSLIEDINGLVEASSALGEFSGIFEEIAAIFTGVDEAAMEATSGIGAMAEEAGVAADALSSLGGDSEGLAEVAGIAGDAADSVAGIAEEAGTAADVLGSLGGNSESLAEIAGIAGEAADGIAGIAEEAGMAVEALGSLGSGSEALVEIGVVAEEATASIASMAEEAGIAAAALSTLGDSEALASVSESANEAASQINEIGVSAMQMSDVVVSAIDIAQAKLVLLQSKVQDAADALAEMQAEAAASGDFSGIDEASAQLVLLQAKAQEAAAALAELTAAESEESMAADAMTESSGAAGNALQSAQGPLLMISMAAIGASKAVFDMGSKAEDALNQVQALAGVGSAQMAQYTSQLEEQAQQFGESLDQEAQGLFYVTSAGFSGADAMKVLTQSVMDAKAGNIDLSVSANGLTTVLNAYGASADQAAHYNDLMVTAVTNGKQTFQDFATSIAKAAVEGNAAHISFNQVAAAEAALTDQGLSARNASNDLTSMMRALDANIDQTAATAGKLGLSFNETAFKSMDLFHQMQYLQDITKGNQTELGKLAGGATGLAAFNALMTKSSDGTYKFSTILDTMQHSTGAASQAFQTSQETISAHMDKLGATFSVVSFKIVDAIGPKLIPLLDHVTDAVTRFADYVSTHVDQLMPVFAGLAAMIGGAVVGAIGAMVVAMWPVLAILGIIGVVVAGVVAAWQHWGDIMKQVNAVAQNPVVSWLLGEFQQLGGYIASVFAPVWNQLVSTWKTQLMPAFQQMWAALVPLKPLFEGIGMVIAGVFLLALGDLIGVISGLAKGLAAFLSGIITIISGFVQMITGLFQIVTGIVRIVIDIFTGNFKDLGPALGQIWQGILNIVGGMLKGMQGAFEAVFGTIWGIISGFVEGVWNFFVDLYDRLIGHSIIPDMINGMVNWFEQLPSRAMTFIHNLVDSLTTTLGGLGAKALTWAQDMINNFVHGIESGVNAVGSAVQKIANKISSFLHFSKPDVGPLADADTWMPDFGNLLSKGLHDQIPKLEAASYNIAESLAKAVNPSTLPQGPSATGGGMLGNEQALQYLAQLVQATQGMQRQQVTQPTSANIGAVTQHFGINVNGVNDLQSLINALNQSQGLQFEYGQRGATFNY